MYAYSLISYVINKISVRTLDHVRGLGLGQNWMFVFLSSLNDDFFASHALNVKMLTTINKVYSHIEVEKQHKLMIGKRRKF